jgi:hypothetical protein
MIEVLKQALEDICGAKLCESNSMSSRQEMLRLMASSITSLRQAIAELESQEPVAWGVFEGNLHDMFFSQAEAEHMALLKGLHAEVRPLYTHPPQRTWVGLTDEDIRLVRHSFPSGSIEDLHSFARAVLDKSKEKNT